MRRRQKPRNFKPSRPKKTKSRSITPFRRKQRISDARLERGLRVLSDTRDIATAARAIRVSPARFKRFAKRKGTIRKQGRQWSVTRRLPRKVPIFTGGRQLALTVRSKSASLIGRYMSAVGRFLETNDLKFLTEFTGRSVKRRSRQRIQIRGRSQRALSPFFCRRRAVRGNLPNCPLTDGARKCPMTVTTKKPDAIVPKK